MRPICLFALAATTLLIAACGSGSGDSSGATTPPPPQPPADGGEPPPPPESGFSYSLDMDLVDDYPLTQEGGTTEGVQDAEGITSLFIGNEVIIRPDSETQLEEFLQRYDAVVLASDEVLEPPPEAGVVLTDEDRQATAYRVLVDPTDFPLDNLADDAQALGIDQAVVVSSEASARLLALVLHETRNGLNISPNFLMPLDDWLESTREHPLGSENFWDPFDQLWYNTEGAQTNVTLMWQAVHATPPPRRVRLAIIDIGFWLDDAGQPFSLSTHGVSDFPDNPLQGNFENMSSRAGGANNYDLTRAWHGNNVAGVAVATLDNDYGIAGTGGQVADPILFRVGINAMMNWYEVGSAIRTAVRWDAQVINLSFGGPCDNAFCDLFLEDSLYSALRNARDNGVIVISSSGNDTRRDEGHHISADGKVPCKAGENICVGATNENNRLVSDYANAGSRVDIWAPGCMPTVPDAGDPDNLPWVCGTSFSSPFVAGVVAVMKAYDPTLGLADVRSILRATAWTDSPDAEVTHAINAYAAVRAVVENAGADPYVHISNTALDSGNNNVPLNRTFTLLAQVYENVFDFMDGGPTCPPSVCPITWSPAPENITSGAVYRLQTTGEHEITATATNSAGNTGSGSVTVNVVNQPPQAIMVQPENEATVYRGQPVSLIGYGLDPNAGPGPEPGVINTGCDWNIWRASPPWSFDLLDCEGSVVFPANGGYTVRLRVVDAEGAQSIPVIQTVQVVDPPAVPGPNAGMVLSPPNYIGDTYTREDPFSVGMSASGNSNTPYTYQLVATSYQAGSTTMVYATTTLDTIVSASSSVSESYTLHNVPGLLLPEAAHDCYGAGQWVRLTLTVLDADNNPGASDSRMIQVLCWFG